MAQVSFELWSGRGASNTVASRFYFRRFRNSSIALRINQETGRSSFTAIFSSFSTCSGFNRIDVSVFRMHFSVLHCNSHIKP
jgi:hypothetical protein